jgi:integrase/recombinase XerD
MPPRRHIDQFLRNVRTPKGKELAERTRQQHRTVVNEFAEWTESEGIDEWFDVRPSDIGAYLTYRGDTNGSSPADLSNHYGSLKRFYDYIGQDYPDRDNPVERHGKVASYAQGETVRKQKGFETGMPDDDYRKLLAGVKDEHEDRDRLVCRILGECGLRRSEASELRIDGIDLDTQRMDVPGTKSEPRVIKFRRELKPPLRRWIHGGQRVPYPKSYESPYLFPSAKAERMSGNAINQMVIKTAWNAGIQEVMYNDAQGSKRHRITAHQLRHYFGKREMRDPDGLGLKALSEYMGHSSVEVTADLYGAMSDDEAFEMFDNLMD